jgi:hypothetical protein
MPWICCWGFGRRQFQPPVDRPKLEYELHTPGITIVQEADVVVNYINRNPDKRDLAAAALVVAAMDEAWCSQAIRSTER